MLEFIVQAIKVLLPCIAAGGVVRYINVQNEKKQQDLSGDDLEDCTVERYEIAYPMVLNVIVCVCFAIIVACIIGYSMEEKQSQGMWAIEGSLLGLYTYGFLGSCVWKIWVNGEQIIYRGYNGIKHYYTFSDITRITEKANGAYIYYAGKKRLFKIDNNLFEGVKLTGRLVRSGVPCDLEETSGKRKDWIQKIVSGIAFSGKKVVIKAK